SLKVQPVCHGRRALPTRPIKLVTGFAHGTIARNPCRPESPALTVTLCLESLMRPSLFILSASLLTLTLAGCANTPQARPDGAKVCPTPRPQACTREYQPVIGFDASGKRLGSYGNHCTACGDNQVIYTLPESRD